VPTGSNHEELIEYLLQMLPFEVVQPASCGASLTRPSLSAMFASSSSSSSSSASSSLYSTSPSTLMNALSLSRSSAAVCLTFACLLELLFRFTKKQ
jgi:hypothetical protein